MSSITIATARVGVVGVFAPADSLDRLHVPAGVELFRAAPDEGAAFCRPGDVGVTLEAVTLQAVEAGGFALDLTDGWSACTVTGEARRAFAYLSELHLPSAGIVAGDVLRVPARVIARESELTIMVPSPWDSYLRTEMRDALRSFDLDDDLVANP